MFKSLFQRFFKISLLSQARQNAIACDAIKNDPQLHSIGQITNAYKLEMIAIKQRWLLRQAFTKHWSTQKANNYTLVTHGETITDFTSSITYLTRLMDTDHALIGADLHLTHKEVNLGVYLTQHDNYHIDPLPAIMAFEKAILAFAKSLTHYLDRNPDTREFVLRLTSSYTGSINNILDDLIEVQCDFLSP